MSKIELEVLALSHSITHSHSYAVVLGEVEGSRRIPIVIGGFEAQAIAIALENMSPSRPLTHDLMKNICDAYGLELQEVIINDLLDGIFFSKLVCKNDKETIEIDSRTSDALALALRFNCPIYTFENIIESAGIMTKEMEEAEQFVEEEYDETEELEMELEELTKPKSIKEYSLDQLQVALDEALNNEDYEKAAELRDELDKRGSSNN
jgi:hypothetical protein